MADPRPEGVQLLVEEEERKGSGERKCLVQEQPDWCLKYLPAEEARQRSPSNTAPPRRRQLSTFRPIRRIPKGKRPACTSSPALVRVREHSRRRHM